MPCALETPCSDLRVVDQVGMRAVIGCRNGHHFSLGVIPPLTPDAELNPEVWRWDCGHFRTLDNTKYDGHVNGCCKTCAQARTRRFGKGATYRTWLSRYLKTRRARALRRRAGRK